MDREAARAAVRKLGGVPAAGVTGTVDLLVVGDGAGAAKLRKAAEFGLRQLPAGSFAVLARDPSTWDGAALGEVPVPAVPEPRQEVATARGVHGAGSCSWMRDGHYVTVVTCRCGWQAEAPRFNDARSLHSAHRRAVDDPDLAFEDDRG